MSRNYELLDKNYDSLNAEGLSDRQIERQLGINRGRIWDWKKARNIPRQQDPKKRGLMGKKFTDDELDKIKSSYPDLKHDGFTDLEIAEVLGVPIMTLRLFVRKNGDRLPRSVVAFIRNRKERTRTLTFPPTPATPTPFMGEVDTSFQNIYNYYAERNWVDAIGPIWERILWILECKKILDPKHQKRFISKSMRGRDAGQARKRFEQKQMFVEALKTGC